MLRLLIVSGVVAGLGFNAKTRRFALLLGKAGILILLAFMTISLFIG